MERSLLRGSAGGAAGDELVWRFGELLQARKSAEDHKVFLSEILHTLRFGFLMAITKAAKPASLTTGERESESVGFVLEDRVYPALARYLAAD